MPTAGNFVAAALTSGLLDGGPLPATQRTPPPRVPLPLKARGADAPPPVRPQIPAAPSGQTPNMARWKSDRIAAMDHVRAMRRPVSWRELRDGAPAAAEEAHRTGAALDAARADLDGKRQSLADAEAALTRAEAALGDKRAAVADLDARIVDLARADAPDLAKIAKQHEAAVAAVNTAQRVADAYRRARNEHQGAVVAAEGTCRAVERDAVEASLHDARCRAAVAAAPLVERLANEIGALAGEYNALHQRAVAVLGANHPAVKARLSPAASIGDVAQTVCALLADTNAI